MHSACVILEDLRWTDSAVSAECMFKVSKVLVKICGQTHDLDHIPDTLPHINLFLSRSQVEKVGSYTLKSLNYNNSIFKVRKDTVQSELHINGRTFFRSHEEFLSLFSQQILSNLLKRCSDKHSEMFMYKTNMRPFEKSLRTPKLFKLSAYTYAGIWTQDSTGTSWTPYRLSQRFHLASSQSSSLQPTCYDYTPKTS